MMALIRNGSNQLTSLSRFHGAVGAYGLRSQFGNSGKRKNFDSGEHAVSGVTNRSAIPQGMRSGGAWKLPTKTGSVASFFDVTLSITPTATVIPALNAAASISLNIDIDQPAAALTKAALAEIVFGAIVDNPSAVGVLSAGGTLSFSFLSDTSTAGALQGAATSITLSITVSSQAKANGFASATISGQGEAVTPETVANAVWEAFTTSHNNPGTMGQALNSAGGAADPWLTTLPGSYLPGTAGQIIGLLENNINLHTDNALVDIDEEVDRMAFEGAVHLNSASGGTGTAFPKGTSAYPVNNWADARAIALANGLDTYHLSGAFVADAAFENVTILGNTGFTADSFDMNNKQFNSCRIQNMTVTGLLGTTSNGANVFHDCYLVNVYQIQGEIQGGRMEADVFIQPGKELSCAGTIVEGDFTIVDMGSNSATVFSADLASGSVLIKNAVTGSLAEMNISGGDITLDASCTGGEYWIEGYGAFYNESTMTEKGNQLIQTVLFAEAQVTPMAANIKKVNDVTVQGSGTEAVPWGPA